MSAEEDPGQSASGSSRRDLGETPSWEDTPARSREETSADAARPSEPPIGGDEAVSPAEARSRARQEGRHQTEPGMLPPRRERPLLERLLVRLIATCGVVAIGVAIAAIMHSSGSQGWLIGLVVSGVSVILAAILWSSRTL